MTTKPICGGSPRAFMVLAGLFILAITPSGPLPAPKARTVPALECPSCDDFNRCTVDSCDAATGTCRHDPLSCDDGNPCTADTCFILPLDPQLGGCRHTDEAAGTACSDGLSCTTGDICNGSGAC